MAAPESTPDLSVVEPEQTPSAGTPASEAPAASSPAPAAAQQPAQSDSSKRRGVPWWVVVVVAVIGLILFLNQYQRAEGLDARVTSLTEELLVADQRLEVAQGQIASHQSHLDRVRAGISALSESVAGLQVLAERDPLAPPVAEPVAVERVVSEEPVAVAEEAGASIEAPAESVPVEGSLTDADGYYWRANDASTVEPAPVPPAPVDEAERRSIIHETVGTPFSDR